MTSELVAPDVDLKRAVVTAGAAAVPIVGGPLAVVLSETWPDRWRRNATEFINGVAEDVEELAFEMATIEQRLAEEDVSEIFYVARQTAQVASHPATRRRCRNAVVNAIRQPENAARNLRMVRLIDELSPAHFSLLVLLRDPMANQAYAAAVQGTTMGSMSPSRSLPHSGTATTSSRFFPAILIAVDSGKWLEQR